MRVGDRDAEGNTRGGGNPRAGDGDVEGNTRAEDGDVEGNTRAGDGDMEGNTRAEDGDVEGNTRAGDGSKMGSVGSVQKPHSSQPARRDFRTQNSICYIPAFHMSSFLPQKCETGLSD